MDDMSRDDAKEQPVTTEPSTSEKPEKTWPPRPNYVGSRSHLKSESSNSTVIFAGVVLGIVLAVSGELIIAVIRHLIGINLPDFFADMNTPIAVPIYMVVSWIAARRNRVFGLVLGVVSILIAMIFYWLGSAIPALN